MMDGDALLGAGLALVDGDIEFDDGDLRWVSGLPNLVQALQLRVLTPFGSDIFNTTYGLDTRQIFTQPGSVQTIKAIIKLNLVSTLGADARVRDIRELLFEDDAGYLDRHPELDANAIAIDRQRRLWKVDVVIDTVTNRAQTLPVDVGV
jgi:phage baseplate assembly protein W